MNTPANEPDPTVSEQKRPPAPLGLLLDVDGPIASPETRTVAIASITRDLVSLANAGVPLAFNTGRSDEFLAEQIIPGLVAGGLSPDAHVWGICEKGAVVGRITPGGFGDLAVDDRLEVPREAVAEIRELVQARFAETMFFDETKRAMASVEQIVDVPSADYRAAQKEFDSAVADIFERRGLGFVWEDRMVPDASGAVTFRIDPTIISTDIESVLSGKDLGAEKLVDLLAEAGVELPTRWRTLGDSRTDYAMADWLHAQGLSVAHVDVRPSDGVLDRQYPVRHHLTKIHDEAGAAYLSRWVQIVEGSADDDESV